MRYVGIDYHKRYSVLCATDERGQELKQRRISSNSATGFAQFFSELGEESKVVMEACWNWGWLYDLLAKIDGIDEVMLAHPYKTRLIAEAQIKTDRLDAQMLAKLLRGDLIAQSHAPSAATRPANIFYGSGSFGSGYARCCAMGCTRFWIDNTG